MKPVLTLLLGLTLLASASATIINVPGDQSTIQAGIDASVDGDTVRVAPDTYVENIDFSGRNIILGSWFLDAGDPSYISSTIIDGNQSGSVVSFLQGEDNSAVITGFTIQNGHEGSYGGGIKCGGGSSPTIKYNTISGNTSYQYGGGIGCHISSPTISNNTIGGNSSSYGGGIYCDASSPAISDNAISGNSADYNGGGVRCGGGSSPTISNNTISENSAGGNGGGIGCYGSNPEITNNTVNGNSANNWGGGIFCGNSSPVISNTIFWGDSAPTGSEIHLYNSSPVITCCDVQGGWPGEGNIDIDPLFRDPENGDFHLMSTECGDSYDSPCVDAGDPLICDLTLDCDQGLGEIRSDMGAYGGGIDCSEIPTLSEWGMLIMGLLLLAIGTVTLVRRRQAAAEKAA